MSEDQTDALDKLLISHNKNPNITIIYRLRNGDEDPTDVNLLNIELLIKWITESADWLIKLPYQGAFFGELPQHFPWLIVERPATPDRRYTA